MCKVPHRIAVAAKSRNVQRQLPRNRERWTAFVVIRSEFSKRENRVAPKEPKVRHRIFIFVIAHVALIGARSRCCTRDQDCGETALVAP